MSSVPDVIALPDKNFESRVAQRKQEEENARAELKAEGLLPDVIELPYNLSSVPDVIALPDKDTEISSPESRPAKEENVQGWGAWGLDKAKTAAKLVVGAAMLAATAAPVLVGTLFEESSASPAGDRFGSINGTYSR